MLRSKARYSATSPLLIAIGNFMLAMMLQIRSGLIEGDGNSTLSLLMHYPEYDDITPILDYFDMIRRGVLVAGAHTGSFPIKANRVFLNVSFLVSYFARANSRWSHRRTYQFDSIQTCYTAIIRSSLA